MVAETLNTNRGRIVAHLLCLGRSLLQGRFGSVGFYCAGIRRELQELMQKGLRQSSATEAASNSRVRDARLCAAKRTEK